MRPSGRNAMRHGRSKLATCVIVKGRFGSGLCSPALTCAWLALENRAATKIASDDFIMSVTFAIKTACERLLGARQGFDGAAVFNTRSNSANALSRESSVTERSYA